jgi:hypothetical protein
MQIPLINIFQIIREVDKTSSVPFLSSCIDDNQKIERYYLKYILDKQNYCGLVYEIIGNKLASALKINVPEIAFCKAGDIAVNNSRIPQNYLIGADSICFASKEIEPHDMISDDNLIRDKTTFNKYLNAEDLLRIALLDLWIQNDDRNSINQNLLAEMNNDGYLFYAIDHFHCFGGERYFNKDFSKLQPDSCKSILTSTFGRSIIQYLDVEYFYNNIAEEFSNLTNGNGVQQIISSVFNQLPIDWKVNKQLSNQLVLFLTDNNRNKAVEKTFESLIY